MPLPTAALKIVAGQGHTTKPVWRDDASGRVPLHALSCPPVPSRYLWQCRDSATTTRNLLHFIGTDSPFLIP